MFNVEKKMLFFSIPFFNFSFVSIELWTFSEYHDSDNGGFTVYSTSPPELMTDCSI